ncbi:MAG: DUF262 domain-containing protein [Candidatus Saccharibacteria bacterium]|nr:DUF262 domain-containing protein [Candidatus Saccharibacteria bacterium]
MQINKKTWPLSTTFTLKSRINTDTDYQRPAVWTTAQKQMLMDSILRGYDVPKFYWHQVSKKPEMYDVVDGQQRLRAIWEFMENKYALAKDADPIDDMEIAGKRYSELDAEQMIQLGQYQLDVAVIEESSDEEVREMFLRLQNGTSLKAQEKRHARVGKMRDFICELAEHQFFKSVHFANSRFTFEHIAAQMCLLSLNGKVCNIKDRDLNLMYDNNKDFNSNSDKAKQVKRVLEYLAKMFPQEDPDLKRYNVISLFILISELMENYVIKDRDAELADWFRSFEDRRLDDEKKPGDEQNPNLVAYHEKTAHSTDAFDSLEYRHKYLMEDLFLHVPNLVPKDPNRLFDEYQRRVIFRKNNGICQECGKKCEWDDYQADHIKPWSSGGKTVVENGQVLCSVCNQKKGAKV